MTEKNEAMELEVPGALLDEVVRSRVAELERRIILLQAQAVQIGEMLSWMLENRGESWRLMDGRPVVRWWDRRRKQFGRMVGSPRETQYQLVARIAPGGQKAKGVGVDGSND